MTSVGVRELRQKASELDQLRAAGEIGPPTAERADLPRPLKLDPSIEKPSAVLNRLREYER